MSRKKKKNSNRSKQEQSQNVSQLLEIAFGDTSTFGYTKLSDNPDVLICVDKIADLVSNMTIHLIENTEKGDKKVKNGLARKIDVEPCKNMTRKTWIYKIVRDLLLEGDGNSIVHISVDRKTGYIDELIPLQMPFVSYEDESYMDYKINYSDTVFSSDEVIHFVLNPHPYYPYKGQGYRIPLRQIVNNLTKANDTKNTFMSGKYMPSLIVSADGIAEEMETEEGRVNILKKYVTNTEGGKPWLIPSDLVNVQQVKPLSLKDIAIIEGMEIDKKTIAGLMGVPAFFLGVGDFNKEEYNNFINSRIMSIGQRIAQTLTRDLLINPDWYFRLNPRSLYSYNITELVTSGVQLIDRIAMRRNELRDWIGLDPDDEMMELIALENYIPADKLGDQEKINKVKVVTEGGDN